MPDVRIGAVDLGSNTLKYAVARTTADGFDLLEEGELFVRVSEGVELTGRLGLGAIRRTFEGLDHVRSVLAEHGVEREVAVATAGLRGVDNADVVVRGAKKRGFDFSIIDGDREAELSFVAPSQLYGPGRVAVFDIGGRSTEITVGRAGEIERRVSLPLGGVRLTERFLENDPPTNVDVEALRRAVRDALAEAPALDPDVPLIGVAGTSLALFGHAKKIAFMREVIHHAEGRRLTVLEVNQSLEKLRAQSLEARYLGDVIPPRRADVIVAGAAIVAGILAHYRRLFFTVSSRGLRYGLLDELTRST